MSIIKKTTNYSQFQFFASNRDMDSRTILESIQKKDMLSTHPIIVNKDLYVIDGQNRLKAAETLGLPIYYIISDDLDEQDIPTCQVQRPWCLNDYLKFYQHRDSYKFIKKIHDTHGIKVPLLVRFCGQDSTPQQAFRKGAFKLKKSEKKLEDQILKYLEFMKYSMEICRNQVKYAQDIDLAVFSFVGEEDYDFQTMKRKVDLYRDRLIEAFKFRSAKVIKENLREIYEYWNKNKKKAVQ